MPVVRQKLGALKHLARRMPLASRKLLASGMILNRLSYLNPKEVHENGPDSLKFHRKICDRKKYDNFYKEFDGILQLAVHQGNGNISLSNYHVECCEEICTISPAQMYTN